jgi:hypothetical protein
VLDLGFLVHLGFVAAIWGFFVNRDTRLAVVGGCSWQHKFLFVVVEILLVEWVELVTMWLVILVKMGLALCLVAGKMEENLGLMYSLFGMGLSLWGNYGYCQ